MFPEFLTEKLEANGVIAAGESDVALTEAFSADVVELEDVSRNADGTVCPSERFKHLDRDDPVLATIEYNENLLHTYAVLLERVQGLSLQERVKSLPILHQLQYGVPRSEGSPEAFFPVRGDEVRFLTNLHDRCILYAWLDSCEPCDMMKEALDEVFDTPEDVLLMAVYGPDWMNELQEFDVKAGPATLFLLRGSVDARFYGARDSNIIEREYDLFRELD